MTNKRLSILQLLESYPPDYGGGAAVTTRDLARALAERGHEVRALCVESGDRPDYAIRTEFDGEVRVDRVNLPYLKSKDPDGSRLGLFEWRRHQRRIDELFANLIGEWRPDLVEYHTVRQFGEQCLTTVARLGVPVVAMLHEAWLICPRLMLLQSPTSKSCSGPSPLRCLECMYSHYDGSHFRAIAKLPWRVAKLGIYPAYRLGQRASARRKVGSAIARSNFMARTHEGLLGGGPVRHIALGLDLSRLPHERPERPRTPVRFGFVGGFQPNKGVYHLLEAARSLKAQGKQFELHIWGPGQQDREAEIERMGLAGRVFLRGMYSPENCWEAYNEIDVAIMATLVSEPLGRVPLEAAAVGAPTIGPAVGGITESIVDGVNGLLYPFRDAAGLERQMTRVIDEPGLIRRLIENLSPPIDVRDAVAAVEAFYYSVLDSSPDAEPVSQSAPAGALYPEIRTRL